MLVWALGDLLLWLLWGRWIIGEVQEQTLSEAAGV